MANILHTSTSGSSRSLGRVVWLAAVLAAVLAAAPGRAEPLKVYTTIPDLASLAREVGGDEVHADSMIAGREDAHFGEPKPSYIRRLAGADMFIVVGLELELGYVPSLLQNARNPQVLPGAVGYLDASSAIKPMQVASGPIDRSMGDVHALGNPHYLASPLNGALVAALIAQRLTRLRPDKGDYFASRLESFRRRLGDLLVGSELARKYDGEKLALLFERGKLLEFLQSQGDAQSLGGWLGTMAKYRGARVVDDHAMWPYFARSFGVEVVGHLEPRSGIPPTTQHLRALVEQMRKQGVTAIIQAPYYDPRHARFVAQATGARIAALAHQVESVDDAHDYLAMIDYNVRTLSAALAGAQPAARGNPK